MNDLLSKTDEKTRGEAVVTFCNPQRHFKSKKKKKNNNININIKGEDRWPRLDVPCFLRFDTHRRLFLAQKNKNNNNNKKQKMAMSSLTSTLWWYVFSNSSKPNEPVIFKCSTYSTSYYNF